MKPLKENSGILPTKNLPFPLLTRSKLAHNFLILKIFFIKMYTIYKQK